MAMAQAETQEAPFGVAARGESRFTAPRHLDLCREAPGSDRGIAVGLSAPCFEGCPGRPASGVEG